MMHAVDLRLEPDQLPAWRAAQVSHAANLAGLCDVREVTPQDAVWIESVVDTVIRAVRLTDGIDRMVGHPGDSEQWLDQATAAVVRALDSQALRAGGQTHGIDLLDPDAGLTRALIRCITTAAVERAKPTPTWDNELVAHLLWWRERAYTAVAAAGQTEE